MPFQAQELDVEKELTTLIAKVQKGHLIELQEICGDWGPLDRNDVKQRQQLGGKTAVGPVSFGQFLAVSDGIISLNTLAISKLRFFGSTGALD